MGDLTISGSAVSYSAAVNCTVTITDQPAAGTIVPGATDTFQIEVTPTGPGAFSVDISVDSDDPDEDPYTFTVSGTAPNIKLQLTPDMGTSIAEQFDAGNPFFNEINDVDLIDVTGAVYSTKYTGSEDVLFRLDIGSGVKTYKLPDSSVIPVVNRRYLYRLTSDPDTISQIIING